MHITKEIIRVSDENISMHTSEESVAISQGNAGLQRYVSRELTHFVAKDLKHAEDQQYEILVKILKDGILRPRISQIGEQRIDFADLEELSDNPNEMINPCVVCFCDIPVADMHIHMMKYGKFGLSFLKSFLVKKGANPLLYVAQNAPTKPISRAYVSRFGRTRLSDYLAALDIYRAYTGEIMQYRSVLRDLNGFDLKSFDRTAIDIGKLETFLAFEFWSFIKFFDTAKQDTDTENYYMEREWRILGKLNFSIEEIHRIILPKLYAQRLRQDVREYCGQLTFSDYL